ncbi:MAG: hypothetical protein C0593_07360 [Marinilabiliales bacterium]|nr:MAG: hypothetical protein C0593_07360 [Marinilabiliales bacterium]
MLILFQLSPFSGCPQISFYKHYTVNEGLPSSVVYDIVQDSLGYIWVATDHGVSRFDGYSFRNFTKHDGLAANSNIMIFEGRNRMIWFLAYGGELSCVHNDSLLACKWNDTLRALSGKYLFPSVRVDYRNNIWVTSEKDTTKSICIDETGQFLIVDSLLRSRQNYSALYRDYNRRNSHCSCEKDMLINQWVHTKEKLYKLGHCYYSVSETGILKYEGNMVSEALSGNIESVDVYCEDSGFIWLRKKWDGVYLYHSNMPENEPVRFLPDIRVTKVLCDRNGNYWVATEGHGLYFIPTVDVYVYNKSNGLQNDNIISIALSGEKLVFASDDGNLYVSDLSEDAKIYSRREILSEEFKYCRDLYVDRENALWAISTRFLRYNLYGKPIPLAYTLKDKSYEFCECQDGNIAVATMQGFVTFNKTDMEYNSNSEGFSAHVRAIACSDNNVTWIGTMNGLYSYDGTKYFFWGDTVPVLRSRITKIITIGDEVWVGTRSDGIIVIKDGKFTYLNAESGLSSDMIKALYSRNENEIWVGTNNGLNKITRKGESFNIDNYSVWDGLPSNEINDVLSFNGYLIIATNFGIGSFDINLFVKDEIPPPLHINNIIINNQAFRYTPDIIYSDTVNSVIIEYTGINFLDPGNVTYRYKVLWEDNHHSPFAAEFSTIDQWVETKNTSLQINVIPGQYTVLLEASSQGGVWPETPVSIAFSVQKPMIQNLWFQLFLMVIFLSIVVFIAVLINRSRLKKEEIKTNLILSEQKVLRAQMNPHFIFNSLNSVQSFILDHDDKKTDLYLSSFSSLMRRFLENSKHNLVSLTEELETIEIYLSLEYMRFEDRFEYQINVSENLDTDMINIPPSLIQPFLENAIWHGLMPKKEAGLLMLDIKSDKEKNTLIITVLDNGIGRDAAAKIKRKKRSHKSTGMENIKERIELMNSAYNGGFELQVHDMHNDEGNSAGTKIVLKIPLTLE